MRIISALLTLLFSASLFAGPSYNRLIVFGDSLSDTGNLYEYMRHQVPQSPPYYKGHFTNGPIWVELLAKAYAPDNPKAFLLNYAFGGAGIYEGEDDEGMFTLKNELSSYLSSHQNQADPDSLYIVWIGANNYLGLPEDVDGEVKDVTEGIRHGLQRLAEAGAQHILLLNIPDLGTVPIAIEFGEVETMHSYSTKHNKRLRSIFADMKKAFPNRAWHYYDVEAMLNKTIASPEKYGFTNIVDTCYEASISKGSRQPIMHFTQDVRSFYNNNGHCDGYLFFDPVHPTSAAHTILADAVLKSLEHDAQ